MNTATMNRVEAGAAINKVRDEAEKIKSDATRHFPEAASPGDFHRQGDIYITLIGGVPAGAKRVAKPQTQLAPGNTQGSRHCLSTLEGVAVFELDKATELDGPIVQVVGTEVTVTHPEHGDVVLPGNGRCYGVTYQRDLDQDERERRVLD